MNTNFLKHSGMLFLACWLMSFTVSAQQQVVPYEGEGVKARDGIGVLQARSEAIDDACLNAVKKATANVLSEEALAKLAVPLEAEVFSRWDRYVQGYEILSEQTLAKECRVKLRVRLFYDRLKLDVLVVDQKAGQVGTKTLVLSLDALDEGASAWPVFTEAIQEVLLDDRIELLDEESKQSLLQTLDTNNLALGDFRQLTEQARAKGVRFIVLSRKLEADDEGCLTRLFLVILDVTFTEPLLSKTYRIKSRSDDCVETERGTAKNIAALSIKHLQVEEAEEEPVPDYGRVDVYTHGMSRFSDLLAFCDLVEGLEEVRDCTLNWAQTGTKAAFRLSYSGNAEELGAQLGGRQGSGLLITIESVQEGELYLLVTRSVTEMPKKP